MSIQFNNYIKLSIVITNIKNIVDNKLRVSKISLNRVL